MWHGSSSPLGVILFALYQNTQLQKIFLSLPCSQCDVSRSDICNLWVVPLEAKSMSFPLNLASFLLAQMLTEDMY